MSTVALTSGINGNSIAAKAVNAAGRLWFFVAVSSQLMLVAYVAVLGLYLSPPGGPGRPPMAAALFVLTFAIGIGIAGATTGVWLPIIRAGRLFLLF
jgi:hypothetical protein